MVYLRDLRSLLYLPLLKVILARTRIDEGKSGGEVSRVGLKLRGNDGSRSWHLDN